MPAANKYFDWSLRDIFHPREPLRTEILETYITIFNVRELSFETDVVPASLSIICMLQPKLPRGFLYGLPISFLDGTLIWRSNPKEPFRRRSSAADNLAPPSWSWAGWWGQLTPTWRTCPLDQESYPPYGLPIPEFPNARTIPFLQWFLQASIGARRESVLFQNDWYDYKIRYFGKGEDSLPEGWSTENYDDSQEWRSVEHRDLWRLECEKFGLDISIHDFSYIIPLPLRCI